MEQLPTDTPTAVWVKAKMIALDPAFKRGQLWLLPVPASPWQVVGAGEGAEATGDFLA
jgi:hypothetical protein